MSNQSIFNTAKELIPGGVNSPVRSFNHVGGIPFFTQAAKDCYLFDSENNKYIDYVCSWGANIVGHANQYVVQQVVNACGNGFSFGTPTELEVELAKQINQLMPSLDKIRLVNSGTEATMTAIRLARGYTNRKYIIKFDGCYHGHSDGLLVKAGSGVATLAISGSSGVPDEIANLTIVLEYNNIDQLIKAFDQYSNQIAGVIIEPIAGNMNLIRATPEFLTTLRKLCTNNNSVLIFDEVMSGFRVALGGTQQIYGITPDLVTLGKVIGGGMPLAAFGGSAKIMDHLAPVGTVYQAGTLSGNPLAVTCGLANLQLIQEANFYDKLHQRSQQLINGLTKIAHDNEIDLCGDYQGGMFGFYFSKEIPTNYAQAKLGNLELFKKFFHQMLDKGVFFAPSMYEAGFVCSAHNVDTIDQTLNIAQSVFTNLKS